MNGNKIKDNKGFKLFYKNLNKSSSIIPHIQVRLVPLTKEQKFDNKLKSLK